MQRLHANIVSIFFFYCQPPIDAFPIHFIRAHNTIFTVAPCYLCLQSQNIYLSAVKGLSKKKKKKKKHEFKG